MSIINKIILYSYSIKYFSNFAEISCNVQTMLIMIYFMIHAYDTFSWLGICSPIFPLHLGFFVSSVDALHALLLVHNILDNVVQFDLV